MIPVCVILGEVMATTVEKMRQAHDAQERATAALAAAMVTDELTGLGNRRKGDQLLETLDEGDALLLCDLDRFKVVNDTFGHAQGDRLLASLGESARRLHDYEISGTCDESDHRPAGMAALDVSERLLHCCAAQPAYNVSIVNRSITGPFTRIRWRSRHCAVPLRSPT